MTVAFPPFFAQAVGVLHHCRRKRNQCEINVARNVCERLIGLYALNFIVVWIDRIDIAGIIIMLEIENGSAADLLFIGRRAHDGDRTRAKQDVQISLLVTASFAAHPLNERGPALPKERRPLSCALSQAFLATFLLATDDLLRQPEADFRIHNQNN